MLKFYLFVAAVLCGMLLYHLATKRYLNPYTLIMVFGKKGSGKSTLLTKMCIDHLRRGWNVYSTTPVPGCNLISYASIGYQQFPPRSFICVDEVGMIWDNRNFKSFKPEVRDWFKLQRHYKCKVALFSQTFDIDKKLRDLTDEMYLVSKKMRVFSYAKKILRRTVLTKSAGDSSSRIDEDLVFDSLFFFWAGSRKLTYIPKWVKYFDSFDAPQLAVLRADPVPPLHEEIVKTRRFRFPRFRR